MGYQGYGQWAQPGMVPEDRILEDLEYLQQMYPTYARKYQGVISSAVDKMDYDGSFIYDQYPDKFTIQRMVMGVMAIIKANEENMMPGGRMQGNMPAGVPGTEENPADVALKGMLPQNAMVSMPQQDMAGSNVTEKTLTENASWEEKEPWIRELVTVLMFYEILTRRRKKNKQWVNNTVGTRYYQF